MKLIYIKQLIPIILMFLYFFIDKIKYIENLRPPLSLLSIEIFNRIIVTSIYYDQRVNSLRLILINYMNYFPNMSCTMKFQNYFVECIYSYKPYMYHNKPHGHLLIHLSKKKYPTELIINNILIPVPILIKHNQIYNLTVCICHTVNYTAVRRVIQTIETYRNYGVDHFDIYIITVSPLVYKVFKYYEMKKVMNIITWNKTLEKSLNFITNGQIFKTNDCLYRNMYKSKALIISDWDEIITPTKENNILNMIYKNYDKKYNWFSFTSFIFRTETYKGNDYDRNILDTDIYQHRKYCILKKGKITKNLYTYLLGIFEVEVHFVYEGSNKLFKIDVRTNDGYVRHTRRVNSRIISYCNTSWLTYPYA